MSLALAIVALGVALLSWDQRSTFVRQLEGRYRAVPTPEYFAGQIHQGDVVYWRGAPERVWFELRTASYAGSIQAVGVVFSERMALEMLRRLGRVAQVGLPDEMFLDPRIDDAARLSLALSRRSEPWPFNLHRWESPALGNDGDLTPTSLFYLCADPALDWVIDLAYFPDLATATENIPVPNLEAGKKKRLVLYDCRRLRKSS